MVFEHESFSFPGSAAAGECLWIGANDIQHEGSYIWDGSKTALTYSRWDTTSSQPNDASGNQDCACYGPVAVYYKWHDYPCSALQPAICEYNFG